MNSNNQYQTDITGHPPTQTSNLIRFGNASWGVSRTADLTPDRKLQKEISANQEKSFLKRSVMKLLVPLGWDWPFSPSRSHFSDRPFGIIDVWATRTLKGKSHATIQMPASRLRVHTKAAIQVPVQLSKAYSGVRKESSPSQHRPSEQPLKQFLLRLNRIITAVLPTPPGVRPQ